MSIIRYKGYRAKVEYDDGKLFVKVLHVADLLVAEVESASEVEKVFHDLIDDYLSVCRELGRSPNKPYSGTFNIRISPDEHRQLAELATDNDVTLNSYLQSILAEHIEDCRESLIVRRANDQLHERFAFGRRPWTDKVTGQMASEIKMLRELMTSSQNIDVVCH